jgi:hypothetical protein
MKSEVDLEKSIAKKGKERELICESETMRKDRWDVQRERESDPSPLILSSAAPCPPRSLH